MRWNLREVEPAAVQAFAEALSSLDSLPESPQLRLILAKLLLLRGITTPEAAVANGADYLVIGRAITQASDPLAALAGINASLGTAR